MTAAIPNPWIIPDSSLAPATVEGSPAGLCFTDRTDPAGVNSNSAAGPSQTATVEPAAASQPPNPHEVAAGPIEYSSCGGVEGHARYAAQPGKALGCRTCETVSAPPTEAVAGVEPGPQDPASSSNEREDQETPAVASGTVAAGVTGEEYIPE